jgi:hypothetical protein
MTVNEVVLLIPAVTAAVVSMQKLTTTTALIAQTHDTTSQIKVLVNGQSEAELARLQGGP